MQVGKRGPTALMSIFIALAAAGTASATGGESASAAGAASFGSIGAFAPRFTPGTAVPGQPGSAVAVLGLPSLGGLTGSASLLRSAALAQAGTKAAAKAPAKEVNLAGLLNRHLKTTLTYTLGGAKVWVSGGFDRAQKAYVSVMEDGKPARFFNVEDLLTKPAQIPVGSGSYKLSLSPDLSDQLDSEVVLTNLANKSEKTRISLRDMLGAITAAGESAQVAGHAYKLFYYDDIKNGVGDPSSRSFAFILNENGEFQVFLVPAELVPSDKVAIFKMLEDKPVGLQQVNGTLRVFDNP